MKENALNPNPTPSRIDFTHSVKKFKSKYNKKLKELLDPSKNPKTVQEFLQNPVISSYLARPLVDFVDGHPNLYDSKNKNEHEASDHYELKIYKYLPNAALYRNANVASPQFYTTATPPNYQLFKGFYASLSDGLSDVKINGPRTIYQIAQEYHIGSPNESSTNSKRQTTGSRD